MTDKLTLEQEAFAMAHVESGNASKAYTEAYDVDDNTSVNIISVEASKLRNNPKKLRDAGACTRRHSITIDSITDELDKARQTAKEARQASAIIAATMGKAKLHGLLTDKADIKSPDESRQPTTIFLVGEPVPKYE